MRRVVITGMGIWSCLGTTLDEVRQSLYDGRSRMPASVRPCARLFPNPT